MKTLVLPDGDLIVYGDDGLGVWLTRARRKPKRFNPREHMMRVETDLELLERQWVPVVQAALDDQVDSVARKLSARSRRFAHYETRKTKLDPLKVKADATSRAQQILDELLSDESLQEEFAAIVSDLYGETADTALGSLSVSMGIDFALAARDAVMTNAMGRANQLAGFVTDTTYKRVKKAIVKGITEGKSIPDIARLISSTMKEANMARATLIARTEVVSAYNGAVYDGGKNLPPEVAAGMVWMAARDERTRRAHANADGQTIKIGEKFIVGGEEMRYPGDPNASPRNTINCRCATAILTPDDMTQRMAPLHEVSDVLVRMAVQGLTYGEALWELRVGDKVGHKFHGNQWAGKGMRPATAEDRKRLVIPPAWTNVVVSVSPKGVNGLIAKGLDAKGRSQRRYSAEHTEKQAAKKFARVKAMSDKLDGLDGALAKDARTSDDAAALQVIRRTGMRPGSTRNTGAEKQAYGATTLEARHVKLSPDGQTVRFQFTGKKGVNIDIEVKDRTLHKTLAPRLQGKKPNDKIFETSPARVGSYLHKHAGPEFKVKDLRTVHANTAALRHMKGMPKPKTQKEFKAARLAVGKAVSAELGNTPQMALNSYINSTVFGGWQAGLS